MANSYDYRFVQNFNERCGHLIGKRLYTFTSTKSHLCYWVWVERYEHDIYAVKFHLKAHRHSKNKYNIKTGTFEPRTIIQTCINIMLDVYHENKHASFGFIGSNSEGEDIAITQRFRIYRTIMATSFSDKYFEHIEYPEKSAYLMVNRYNLSHDPGFIEKIEDAFIKQYPYFE